LECNKLIGVDKYVLRRTVTVAMTYSFRLLVVVLSGVVSSAAQERINSLSDRGCHSYELAPDVAEWSDANEDDVTVHMTLSNQVSFR